MGSGSFVPIVVVSLTLGMAAGFVMHRADFCMVCAFRNFFLFGDRFMFRMIGVLVVAATLLHELGRLAGILSSYPLPLLGPPSLTTPFGGFLFGVGMVLAGGCVVGSLYRIGAGSLLGIFCLAGLVLGSALYAEIHPWWKTAAAATRLTTSRTIPESLNAEPALLLLPMLAVAILILSRAGKLTRQAHAEGYLQPWIAAVILACLGFCSAVLVGMPLGITTAYSKIAATLLSVIIPDHTATLAFYREVPLDYLPPFATERVTGGPGPHLDAVAAIQYPLIAGIICGSAISSLLLKEFRFFRAAPIGHCLSAFSGGVIMGLASRMAPGCNIWHIWGGLPILAWQSILFLAGLFPGAWLGSRLLLQTVVKP